MYPQQNNFYSPYARSQSPSNNIIWVQGIEGAKAQQIQPGSTLLLLDSEQDRFYIKACDQYGICLPLRAYNFTEVVETADAPSVTEAAAATPDLSKYVTKEELTQILKELKQSEQSVSATTKYVTTAATK